MLAVAAPLLAWSLAGSPEAAAVRKPAPAAVSKPAEGDALHLRLRDVRRRSEEVRPGTPEAKALAAELSEIGAAYLEKRDLGRAIELLGEAYRLGFRQRDRPRASDSRLRPAGGV